MVGCVLVSGSAEAWEGLSIVLQARLTVDERAKLAIAALRSIDPEPREMVFNFAHWGVADPEAIPLGPLQDDADAWAEEADRDELVAYGRAAVQRLVSDPLAVTLCKQLFVQLWQSFSEADRMRFAQRIDPDGLVIRRDR